MHNPEKASLSARFICAAAVLLAAFGAFVGSGVLGGTPIAQAAEGRLSADATLLAPGTGAFAIWSFIYTALCIYAIWQLTPAASVSQTQRKLRPLAAASAILNALWIGSVQLGWLGISVLVILILLAVLSRMFMLMRPRIENTAERWITAVTFGPYLGWVSVATVANIAAWLASLGIGEDAAWTTPLAAILVVVAALIGTATVLYSRGRLGVAMAMTWGIAWIGIGRSDGGLLSAPVATTAFVAAGALFILSVVSTAMWSSHGTSKERALA